MTNEIKEILDEIKEVGEYSTASNLVRELDSKDCKLLLHYITNLQQRQNKLLNFIMFNKELFYGNNLSYLYDELVDILRGDE